MDHPRSIDPRIWLIVPIHLLYSTENFGPSFPTVLANFYWGTWVLITTRGVNRFVTRIRHLGVDLVCVGHFEVWRPRIIY